MKKVFLFAIVLCCSIAITNAQDFKFGVKGGVNFAQLNGDGTDNLDAKTGFHLGVVAELSLMDKFAIQPEVLYSAQGAGDTDIDYLNIPILVKYKFLKFLNFEAGPQFGILVNDSFTFVKPETFDLGLAVGAGVEFGKFFSQLRYNHGLLDVVDNGDIKNSTFQLSVGYYIF